MIHAVKALDLDRSLAKAERRLGERRDITGRKPRSDAGRSRLPAGVAEARAAILHRHERPSMREVRSELESVCARLGERTPARATIQRFMTQCPHGSIGWPTCPNRCAGVCTT